MKAIKSKVKNYKEGYTIIETMIAVSLFLIVVLAGMGALLNANLLHQKSRDMRSIMDSLSFVMDDISKNLRTGYDYHCIDETTTGSFDGTDVYSCQGGLGISFLSSKDVRWMYYLDLTSNDTYGIFKKVGNEQSVQLTPSEVVIDPSTSFIVTGAEPPPGNTEQPFVTIRLIGTITYKDVATPFSLQTSVSQRSIDI